MLWGGAENLTVSARYDARKSRARARMAVTRLFFSTTIVLLATLLDVSNAAKKGSTVSHIDENCEACGLLMWRLEVAIATKAEELAGWRKATAASAAGGCRGGCRRGHGLKRYEASAGACRRVDIDDVAPLARLVDGRELVQAWVAVGQRAPKRAAQLEARRLGALFWRL